MLAFGRLSANLGGERTAPAAMQTKKTQNGEVSATGAAQRKGQNALTLAQTVYSKQKADTFRLNQCLKAFEVQSTERCWVMKTNSIFQFYLLQWQQ